MDRLGPKMTRHGTPETTEHDFTVLESFRQFAKSYKFGHNLPKKLTRSLGRVSELLILTTPHCHHRRSKKTA